MSAGGSVALDPVAATVADAPARAPSPAPDRRSHRVLAAAGLIVLAGAAVRFALLSTSIWFDEAVSVRDVSGSFGQMLHRVINHEASPPFYFICLWIWRHVAGGNAVELRTLSALAGTMTIALAFYIARPRVGQRAALFLAACVAISPVPVYYSTEMRMYGMLMLICGVGFEAFLRSSRSPSAGNLSVWAGASLLALWTQYYAALVVAPEAVWLIALAWRSRPRSRATLGAVGGVVLGGLPLLYLMSYQARHAWRYGIPLVSSVWHRIALSIHYPSTFRSIAEDAVIGPGGPARGPLTILVVLIGVAAVALLLRRRHPTTAELTQALILVGPAVAAVALLVDSHVLVEGRYLLPFWLPIGLVVSCALASASAGPLGIPLAAALLCLFAGVGVVSLTVPKLGVRDDTLGAARSLGMAGSGRLIAINEPWDVLPLEEYRPQTSPDTRAVVRTRELDVVAMPAGAEPFSSEHQRPSSLGVGALPAGLRLAQIIRAPTFLVERFVAKRPVSIRVDGQGGPFTAVNWRFLAEPAGGRMGSL